MKRFSLRIDEGLLAKLAALAEKEHRSINEQLLVLIEQATNEERRTAGRAGQGTHHEEGE